MDELEKYIRKQKDRFEEETPKNIFSKISSQLKDEEDSLEDFIHANRNKFNDATPSESNWNEIQKKLPPIGKAEQPKETKVVSLSFVWRMAASFLVILCASIYMVWKVAPAYNQNETQLTELAMEDISPELAQAEQYYTQVIHEHIASIDAYAVVDNSIKEQFKSDISELDSAYSMMKGDLIQNTDNELVVSQMIQNLQIRVELLSRQIMILENIKQEKNENTQNL